MLNVELLLKVKEAILAHPEHFDMASFVATKSSYDAHWSQQLEQQRCGTTACIAGWAVALTEPGCRSNDVPDRAIELLEIDLEQESELFYASMWPAPFASEYDKAEDENDHVEMARIAAARIDSFIAEHSALSAPTAREAGKEREI